jgi:hypothetical protein
MHAGLVACHRGDPGAERRRLAQGVEAAQRPEEDFLEQVVDVVAIHVRQQHAMDESGESLVQLAEGGAIPRSRRVDEILDPERSEAHRR